MATNAMTGSVGGRDKAASTDEIFIRAPQRRIARALLDLSDDASWWSGARVEGGYGWLRLDLPGEGRGGRVRFRVSVGPVREWEGFGWVLDEGELRGRAEFWLEAFKDGTIVHYFVDAARAPGGARRMSARMQRHRLAMRAGLNALKDALERAATSSTAARAAR